MSQFIENVLSQCWQRIPNFPLSIGSTVCLTLLILGACLFKEGYRTDYPRVNDIPEAPGSRLFIGHLSSLGGRLKLNDATVFSRWGSKLSSGIFQIKFGSQRYIIVGSWAAMKELWIDRNTSLLDRVHHRGYLDYIGVDISGSPLTPQIRKCRTAALVHMSHLVHNFANESKKALGKPMWPHYYALIEHNSVDLVRTIFEQGENGSKTMETYPWLRQMMLDLTLNLTYGARAGDLNDELTNSLLNSLYAITSVRGSTAEYRHFVPLMNLIPRKGGEKIVIAAAQERQRCIDIFYGQYLDKVEKGESPTCIVSSLGADKLTLDEIHGTCMSLLQAAPDTVSSSVYQCCAWLSSPEGQPFQKEVYAAILKAYDGDRNEAFEMAFQQEKVPLIVSLYKETLRFYSTAAFNHRRASKEIKIYGTTIPKGMGVTMNIQGVNHDPEHYGEDAFVFNPRRFVDDNSPLPHLSYGVGGRICPAYQLSNRIMGATLTRLILAFEMQCVEGTRMPNTDMIDFSDKYGLVAMPRTYDCAYIARDEKWLKQVLSV